MTSAQSNYCEIDFPYPSNTEGRLSTFFNDPECTLIAKNVVEVPELLSKVETYALSGYWVVGFVAYEAASAFDKSLHTNDATPSDLPFAMFAVYRNTSTKQRQHKEHLAGAWHDETAREKFNTAVENIKDGIAEGDFYQVNYTTRLQTAFLGDGLSFYDRLKASQPLAYCAYLDFGEWQICSVSPELFFHLGTQEGSGRKLTCRPMKGTAQRHSNPGDDLEAAHQLQHSAKEKAENLMIVDLVRNDMSRVAQTGTVMVPHLFSVEAWPTVWQMTSTITCLTKEKKGLVDIFSALFPCGSVTGAPKAASMASIKELEATARGVYCGAIGIVKPGGEALFSVGIRTPVINVKEKVVTCGIGSGITIGSEADKEYAEWQVKQAFLRQSCREYELLETIRLHQGRYWLLQGHLNRIERSAMELGFKFDANHIMESLKATAKHYTKGQWRIRLCLSCDGKINIEILELNTIPRCPQFVMASDYVASDYPWLQHKTTRREVYADLMSKQAGIFDTLLFNERDELTEFTRGNIVLELQGRLITPMSSSGLLPGVFREILLNRKRVIEAIVTKEDLMNSQQIWFVNSVRGAVAVNYCSNFTTNIRD